MGKLINWLGRRKLVTVVGVLVVGTAIATGCSAKYAEPFKDAPRSTVDNGQPADLIRMPDGFSNAATKCDHGNRVYVAYHGDAGYAAIFVVPQDPTCAGK